MTNWIISSSVLILIVICMRYFLKGKISARLQYALWLIVAIRLLIPFSFGNSILSVENITDKFSSTVKENYQETTAQEEYIYNEQFVEEPIAGSNMQTHEENNTTTYIPSESKISSNNFLFLVWMIGVVFTATIFAVTNIVFGIKNKKSRNQIYVNWCKIPVCVSEEVETPCLAGLFSPVIYITKEVAEHSTLLRHTVTHEMMHYKQGDSLWALVRCVCLALHWYNPLVWWAAILSKKDAEFSCDEATIRALGEDERKEYGKTLIQLSSKEKYNLFLNATAMTSGKKSIKERIIFIAKKPKAKWYALIVCILLSCVAVGCTFTQGETRDNGEYNVVENGTETEDDITESKEQELSSYNPTGGPVYYEKADENKVCLAVMPDGISKAGGDYRYIIPEDQTKWMDGYKLMRSYATGNGKWRTDEQSMGVWIVFGDEWTHITDQGFIFDFEKRIEKSEAEDFYNLCMEEARKNETGTPVRPEDISDIASATLQIDGYGAYAINDDAILAELQKSLSTSTELRGGAACPFTASLILKLENGEMYIIYLATDTCSTWISDGVYYEDHNDFIVNINDMIAARNFVTDFTEAYFTNDMETLQEYMLPTSSVEVTGYSESEEPPVLYTIDGLEACIDNFKSRISVEFKVSEDADYYVYLEINIRKYEGEWKVESYWLEQ